MTHWVRLWADMPTDPKWRTIARKSGQPLPCVMAVFTLMMVSAGSNQDERGTMADWDAEDAASALDMDEEAVEAIVEAMQGRVLDGMRLTGWDKRQPKREDGGATQRKQAQRQRDRESGHTMSHNVTHGHAPEAEAEAEAEAEVVVDDDARENSEAVDVDAIDADGIPSFARQCAQAAGVAIASPRSVATAIDLTRSWIAAGALPDEIIDCIKRGVANAPDPIHSLRYFGPAIRQAIARRCNGVEPSPARPSISQRSAWTKPK